MLLLFVPICILSQAIFIEDSTRLIEQNINIEDSFIRYKNTFYVESFGATGFGISINYKRAFVIGERTSLNLSAGFGGILLSWNQESEIVIPLSLTFLSGKKHAFEAGIGYSHLIYENIKAPNIVIAYRLQSGRFFFWFGIVNLIFIEQDRNDTPDWPFIPAPGIRFGTSF